MVSNLLYFTQPNFKSNFKDQTEDVQIKNNTLNILSAFQFILKNSTIAPSAEYGCLPPSLGTSLKRSELFKEVPREGGSMGASLPL